MSTQEERMLLVWGLSTDGQLGLGTVRGQQKDSLEEDELSTDDSRQRSSSDDWDQESEPLSVEVPTVCDRFRGGQVLSVSCGSRHTLACTTSGMVFSWGWGGCYQLGHGEVCGLSEPQPIEGLKGIKIVSVSAGGIHSAALSDAKEIYTWGHGAYGQLGLGSTVMAKGFGAIPQKVCIAPTATEAPHHASSGSIGGQRDIARGVGMGICHTGGPISRRQTLEADVPLLANMISCGGMHMAAISIEGQVYCWGRADGGQLGIGYDWVHETDESIMGMEYPQQVKALDGQRAAQVSCGGFHTAVVMENGDVYSWGKEDHGLLGCSNDVLLKGGGLTLPHLISVGRPRLQQSECGSDIVVSSEKASFVRCGGWHTLVITRDGSPWACGRNEYGRLGLGDESSKRTLELVSSWQTTPQQTRRVIDAALGGTHTLLLTDDGTVLGCGRAEDYRLGLTPAELGSRDRVLVPTEVTALSAWSKAGWRVVSVSAGGAHSAAILVRIKETDEAPPSS